MTPDRASTNRQRSPWPYVRATLAASGLLLAALALALTAAPADAEKIYFPGKSFGEEGTGPGQLKEPIGIAVNDATSLEPGAGDVYVADTGNNRVERFSAEGKYLGRFDASGTYFEIENGKEEEHTGKVAPTGAFNHPEQVAVDNSCQEQTLALTKLECEAFDPSDGDVYVTDTGNKVIDKFSPTGEYLGQITTTEECENQEVVVAGMGCPKSKLVTVPFDEIRNVTVDTFGKVWVYEAGDPSHEYFAEFNANGAFLSKALNPVNVGGAHALGVDSAGRLYFSYTDKGEVGRLVPPEGEFATVSPFLSGEGVTSLALVPPNSTQLQNTLLIGYASRIVRYGAFGEPLQQPLDEFPNTGFPSSFSGLSESLGIAVNGQATVFATEKATKAADRVETFAYVAAPSVATKQASEVSETALTLHATVNPEGEKIKLCFFEYGTQAGKYEHTVPCAQSPASITGSEPTPVSATIEGLAPAAVRSFRIVAQNSIGVERKGSGLTVARPQAAQIAVAGVGSASAKITAILNAGSLSSCYWVEYGLTSSYGTRAPAEGCLPAGASSEGVAISLELRSLSPDTTYHYGIAAKNALGEAASGDETFRTFAPTARELPDGRVDEAVSAVGAGGEGEVYVPRALSFAGLDAGGVHGLVAAEGLPQRSAPDGNTVAYVADPPPAGGDGNFGVGEGNSFLARRAPGGGWSQVAVDASGTKNNYVAMSSDLATGVVRSTEPLGGSPPAGYQNLFSREIGWSMSTEPVLGGLEPILTTAPGCEPKQFGAAVGGDVLPLAEGGIGGANAGTATVHAFSHVLFEANAELPSSPVATAPSGCSHENDLYDSVSGRLYLVNVLPDGAVRPDAMFGRQGPSEGDFFSPDRSDAISTDGARIFWSTIASNSPTEGSRPLALYARLNGTQPASKIHSERCVEPEKACTIQLDASALPGTVSEKEEHGGEGEYWDASADGARILFTDQKALTERSTASPGHKDLYQYDLSKPEGERLEDISLPSKPGTTADVQGVVGESEDGSYVYFVASGVLTEGVNAEGREPAEGQPNLYLRHEGRTSFIATLSRFDGNLAQAKSPVPEGDVNADPGRRTADVTPDGKSVAFTSRAPLTGYENQLEGTPLAEVYVYNAGSRTLHCASCNPSGEPPTASIDKEYREDISGEVAPESPKVFGSFLPAGESLDGYQPRLVSEDGKRVFFNSVEPLVPQDTNGFLDVYEWEAPGEGSCTEAEASPVTGGCTYLLSGGQSLENSYLIDASANGSDLFFVSRGEFVKHDEVPGFDELYDARVGGVEGAAEPSCEGTGCQGVPPAPPQFATPSSDTYNGSGNAAASPPPPASAGKHLTPAQQRAAKLAAALKACRRRYPRNRTHRQSCERAARKHYGIAAKAKAGAKAHGAGGSSSANPKGHR